MSHTSQPPDPTGEIPARLGPFEIIGLLGEGGSGVVYSARWGHREVALKVLHPRQVASERERERFFAEARLLADITHPSVVKVLGVDALPDGRPYLAMEKIEGQTLAARLRAGGLSIEQALSLFEQLVGAVDALHRRGLIHRDLKPENIMLVEGDRFAVLLDFGIAKEVDAPASTVTQEGAVRGTPAYMAPERFFGEPANTATDIYELGVVLYAMLVGRLPWDAAGDAAARLNPTAPSQLGVELPGRLEAELLAALSTRPEARPSSAASFMGRIREATGTSMMSARRTADIPAPQIPLPRGVPFLPTEPAPPSASEVTTSAESPRSLRASRRVWPYFAGGGILLAATVALAIVFWPGGEGKESAAVTSDAAVASDAAGASAEAIDAGAQKPGPTQIRPVDVQALAKAMRHFTVDVRFVVGVNAHSLLHQSAFGPLLRKAKAEGKGAAVLAAFSKACDVDFFEHLDWVVLGIVNPDKNDYDVILSGQWKRANLERCLSSGGATEQNGRLTRAGKSWFGWINDRTVFYTTRDRVSKRWIEDRLAGKRSLATTPQYAPLQDKIDRTRTLWFLGGANDILEERVGQGIPQPSYLYGSIAVSKDVKGGVYLRYRNPKHAKTAGAKISAELDKLRADPAGTMLLGNVRIETKGREVYIRGHLDAMVTSFLATYVAEAVAKKLDEK